MSSQPLSICGEEKLAVLVRRTTRVGEVLDDSLVAPVAIAPLQKRHAALSRMSAARMSLSR